MQPWPYHSTRHQSCRDRSLRARPSAGGSAATTVVGSCVQSRPRAWRTLLLGARRIRLTARVLGLFQRGKPIGLGFAQRLIRAPCRASASARCAACVRSFTSARRSSLALRNSSACLVSAQRCVQSPPRAPAYRALPPAAWHSAPCRDARPPELRRPMQRRWCHPTRIAVGQSRNSSANIASGGVLGALLVGLPDQAKHSLGALDLAELHRGRFADAQPAGIRQLKGGSMDRIAHLREDGTRRRGRCGRIVELPTGIYRNSSLERQPQYRWGAYILK